MARLTGRTPTASEAAALHDFKEEAYRKLAKGRLKEVPGLSGYLNFLQHCSIPYAMVTSSDRTNVEFGLAELGLTGEFALRVYGQDVTDPKPHPEPYLKGAALLGIPPQHCWAHEDSLSGVKSATAAGIPVCAISTTQSPPVLLQAGATWAVTDFNAWQTLLGQ